MEAIFATVPMVSHSIDSLLLLFGKAPIFLAGMSSIILVKSSATDSGRWSCSKLSTLFNNFQAISLRATALLRRDIGQFVAILYTIFFCFFLYIAALFHVSMGCVHPTTLTPDVLVLQHFEKTATLLPIGFSTGTQIYVDNCSVVWKISRKTDPAAVQRIHTKNTLIISLPACPYIRTPTSVKKLTKKVVCTCTPFVGPDLFEWIQTPFSWDQAAAYLEDICNGIRWLHRHNIGHGDIKPENVVIGTNNAQLIDFDFSGPFKDWKYCGTPTYIAPLEIVKEWNHISRRMDVYAYGKTILVVLFFYSVHTSSKTARWLYEPYISELSRHTYTGKQKKWGDLAFQCCRKVPPINVSLHQPAPWDLATQASI